MQQIINGLLYDTKTATLIADDEYFDGHNYERDGCNTFLYKTTKGNFFTLHTTHFAGSLRTITPCKMSRAKQIYEGLTETKVDWEDAFGSAPEIA